MTAFLAAPRRLILVTWLVALLAAVDFVLIPERAASWLFAVALMVGIRCVVGWPSRRSDAARRALRDAGVLGGLILVASLSVALLRQPGLADEWAADRSLGIVTGLVLLVMGNAIPKASISTDGSSRLHGTYAARRFAGWMFAGAGAVGLSAWLFSPIAEAGQIATVACFSALALVVVRCVANPANGATD